jgi:4-amino-4-deoxy-L-arabinose transferase-like glycosyltransferase
MRNHIAGRQTKILMIARLSALLPITAILCCFLVLSIHYNTTIPLWEGPDEPGHMRYILFLAHEHRLPVQRSTDEASDVPGEGHQPPLAYLLALPSVLLLPEADRAHLAITHRHNPAFVWGEGGNSPAAFVRASSEYRPWQGITLAAHRARAVSSLWGALAIFCTWGAATTLLRQPVFVGMRQATKRWVPLVAALLMAFSPQFLFTSALVTNDMLLVALSSLLFWLCIIEPPHPRLVFWRTLATGGVLGLALLTKQSGMLWVPVLLWRSWHDAGLVLPASRSRITRMLTLMALWGGSALLVCGWWYGRNLLLYGDLLGISHFQATFATQPFDWHSSTAWLHALLQLHTSFWAMFGWVSLPAPSWALAVYTAIEVVALLGWGMLVIRSRRETYPAIVLLLPLLAVAWVVVFGLTAGVVAWQGRLLFPALPAIALLLARGLVVWLDVIARQHRPRPCSGHALVVLSGVGLMWLAIAMATGVIAPAYTWHTLPAATAMQQVGEPVYARYAKEWERGAELRGITIRSDQSNAPHQTTVQAGQVITVTCTWHALETLTYDWTVFVHLVDDTGKIVAEHNSKPQGGAFSMLLWSPGDWLHDPHPLTLPANLPPGVYTLRVGWYKPWQRDPQKGSRQQVWNEVGEHVGDFAEVGRIAVPD